MAGEKIAEAEIGNAFAFIGAGGHHSGRDFFGGYCCFNDVALCVVNLCGEVRLPAVRDPRHRPPPRRRHPGALPRRPDISQSACSCGLGMYEAPPDRD